MIEQPDDHDLQHGDGQADPDFLDHADFAEVGLDQLEHARVRRHPGQRAEANDEGQFLEIALGFAVVGGFSPGPMDR